MSIAQTEKLPSASVSASAAQVSRWGLIAGFALLLALTVLVAELDRLIADTFKAQGVARNPLEYPLTAVLIGLAANGLLRLTRLYEHVRRAFRTEFYLKIGLVLLGVRVSLGDLLATGAAGLVQALIMVTSVFFFTWWLAGRFSLPPTLKAVMASAVSICGVSAAIAAAGAVMAKKEEVTYITALVILTAIPLMVLMPLLADTMSLTPQVAGAWFGGNIDTTAAVVGAGTMHSQSAQEVAAVVKMAQNVLIGFVAFALALYFAVVVEGDREQRPSPAVIWRRFPKFVIGFVIVSALATLGAFTPGIAKEIERAGQWAFALAFVCIGVEFAPGAIREMGWKPVAVYLGATVFNTVLALAAAAVIFGALAGG